MILEEVLVHHPKASEKIGCGVDYVQVRVKLVENPIVFLVHVGLSRTPERAVKFCFISELNWNSLYVP